MKKQLTAPPGMTFMSCQCGHPTWHALGRQEGLTVSVAHLMCAKCHNVVRFTADISQASKAKAVDGVPTQ